MIVVYIRGMAKYFLPPDAPKDQTPRKAGGERLAQRLLSKGYVQVPSPPTKKRIRAKNNTYYVNGQYDGGN